MSPSTKEEIRLLIDSLNPIKAIRKLDVEAKFLKFGVNLRYTEKIFFNKFVEEVIYPCCLKIAEVIPVFKKGN